MLAIKNNVMAGNAARHLGTSYDTPEFAVDCIASWWERIGRRQYEPKILILADGGGHVLVFGCAAGDVGIASILKVS